MLFFTPNLGLGIAIFDWKREQGRFRGSIEGASREHRRSKGRAVKEEGGVLKE